VLEADYFAFGMHAESVVSRGLLRTSFDVIEAKIQLMLRELAQGQVLPAMALGLLVMESRAVSTITTT